MAMGLGAFGRSFTLQDSSNYGYNAPAKLGNNGLTSGDPGQSCKIAYPSVSQTLKKKGKFLENLKIEIKKLNFKKFLKNHKIEIKN